MNMIDRVVPYGNILLIGLALVATIIATVSVVAPTPLLIALIEGAVVAISCVIVAMYAPGLIRDVADPIDGVYLLRLGICLTWLATGAWTSVRVLLAIATEAPLEFVVPVRGYIAELLVAAGFLHVIAIGWIEGRPAWRNVVIAVLAVVSGSIGAAVMVRMIDGIG
jgi:hypothetical protein